MVGLLGALLLALLLLLLLPWQRRPAGGEYFENEGGDDAYTAIIVEPRKHAALFYVVENALETLGERWNVIHYHGTQNEAWAQETLAPLMERFPGRLSFRSIGLADLPDGAEYSKFFYQRDFLAGIPTEMFIVFQTDSMFCGKHPELLESFMKYDFVGAPYQMGDIYMMNGGFSLRRKSKMLEILDNCPLPGGNEDYHYSVGCDKVRPHVPPHDEAARFSLELFKTLPENNGALVGIHQPRFDVSDMEGLCPGIGKLRELNDNKFGNKS